MGKGSARTLQHWLDEGYDKDSAEKMRLNRTPGTTFFVDGYDKQNNVVVEFDERYHLNENQKQKDKERQGTIGNILKCTFIRISSKLEITKTNYK